MRIRTQLILLLALLIAATQVRGWWLEGRTRELLDEANARRERQVALEEAAGELGLAALDLETGLRGWLVARDPLFLEPYRRAQERLPSIFVRGEKLVADSPALDAALADVRLRIDDWQHGFAAPLLAPTPPGSPETAMTENLAGSALMDDVRNALGGLRRAVRDETERDRAADVALLERQSRNSLVSQLAILVCVALLVLAISLQIERPLALLAEMAERMDLTLLARVRVRGTHEARVLGRALARLGKELGEREESERRHAELLVALARASGAAALARDVLALLVRHTGARGGVLWAASEADGPLARLAVEGFDPAHLPLEACSAVDDARATGRAARFDSASSPERFLARTSLGTFAPGTVLVAPLVSPDSGTERVLGVLELVGEQPGAFPGDLGRELASISLALGRALANERVRHLHEQLARERAQLRSVFQALPDGVVIVGPEGLVVRSNPAADRLLGPIAGRRLEELTRSLLLTAPDGSPSPPEGSDPRTTELIGMRRRVTTPDGSVRQLVLSAVPLPEVQGRSFVVSFRDETREHELQQSLANVNEELRAQNEELRAQEEELRAQSEALAQASNAKSDFLNTMSHELRTPLNAVIGFSELLLSDETGRDEASRRSALTDILAAGQQLLRLINEILDLSRLEAGRLDLQLQTVELAPVVSEALVLVAPAARGKKLEVRSDVAPELRARADPDRLRQVLANLLANAVKFTPEGGRVVVGARMEGDSVRLTVRDTGIGISPADLGKLFQPFTQVGSGLARAHGGSGLGLSISRRLAQAMGGDITAASTPGEGSEFTCVLPASDDLVSSNRPSPGGPARSVAGLRVLLIEDEDGPRRLVEAVLGSAGYAVQCAASAEEAFERLATTTPDLVLLDLCLPGLSGTDFLARLRADPARERLPVVVLTAKDLDPAERAFLEEASQLVARKGAVSRAEFLVQLERLVCTKDAGASVLVVDDNAMNRHVARAMLEAQGHRVLEASDAARGIELARSEGPDLVLMDLEMPGMDGLAATRALKADPRTANIPVVAMTAHVLAHDRVRAAEAGCAEFVAKPVGRRQLADALGAALSKKQRVS